MEALELLKTLLSELRSMQFDPLQRSHGEVDAGYRNGHNDGVRAAIKACEQHLGFAFACTSGCGWTARARAASSEGAKLMLRFGSCPDCKQNYAGKLVPVEMAEVVL